MPTLLGPMAAMVGGWREARGARGPETRRARAGVVALLARAGGAGHPRRGLCAAVLRANRRATRMRPESQGKVRGVLQRLHTLA